MLRINLTNLLLQGFPESIALVLLSFSLSKTNWQLKKVFLIAFLQICSAYVVRFTSISFGAHSIILVIAFTSWLRLVGKIDYLKALYSALISFIVLIVGETAIYKIILTSKGLDFSFDNVALLHMGFLYGLPHVGMIFILALLVKRVQLKSLNGQRQIN